MSKESNPNSRREFFRLAILAGISAVTSSFLFGENANSQEGLSLIRLVEAGIPADQIRLVYKYASENVFGAQFYPDNYTARLIPEAASSLKKAFNLAEERHGWKLQVMDAYRDDKVQTKLYKMGLAGLLKKITPSNIGKYIAKPKSMGGNGSGHSKGTTVDLIAKNEDGSIVNFGSKFDEFGSKAHYDSSNENQFKLREIMEECGFNGIASEWWHFEASR
jgi:zinc D-Ala-D-Ala dipeptidase